MAREEVAPTGLVGEAEAAQIEDGLCAGLGPAHAGSLRALADEGTAGCLDDARADGELLGDEVGIAHAVVVGSEVVLRVLEFVLLLGGVCRTMARIRQDGCCCQAESGVRRRPPNSSSPCLPASRCAFPSTNTARITVRSRGYAPRSAASSNSCTLIRRILTQPHPT